MHVRAREGECEGQVSVHMGISIMTLVSCRKLTILMAFQSVARTQCALPFVPTRPRGVTSTWT